MKHVAHIQERKALVEGGEALNQIIERFLRNHDVKEISRHGYRRRLRDFRKWVTALENPAIDRETLVAYRRSLRTRKLAAYTQSSYLVALRIFFTWLEAEKIWPNLARGLKGPKRDKSFRKDNLSIAQIFRLLESIDCSTLHGKRDFAMLNLMIRTGPRPIEVVRADVDDLRQEGGQMVLWLQGKGSDVKDEFVCLTEATLQPILEYLDARGNPKPGEPLFTSVSDRGRTKKERMTSRGIRRIAKARFRSASILGAKVSAGSTRHTAASLVLMAGGSLESAQELLRHASPATTILYARRLSRASAIPERKIDEILHQGPKSTKED